MGQQQLLLIVLGVIIVGIAVITGLNLFKANSIESRRNHIISECYTLASMAQKYYLIPSSLGGGSNSFVGWRIPPLLDTTAEGVYTIISASAQEIKISGVEKAPSSDQDTIKVVISADRDNYSISTGN